MRALAAAAPLGHSIELRGVEASVMPSAPERSVINCVVYEEAERRSAGSPAP